MVSTGTGRQMAESGLMPAARPKVSVIITTYNEEKNIEACLNNVLGNDYDPSCLEIIVVDGMSTDGTRAIIDRYMADYDNIKLFDNPKRYYPAAMNVGIKHSTGEIILIAQAHGRYPTNYISQCVDSLLAYGADNVGGVLKNTPPSDSAFGRAIAASRSHWFGAGSSRFRLGTKDPAWVDTVFPGCYRREVFEEIGLYNEDVRRGSDMDMNFRLRQAGKRTLLVPWIEVQYHSHTPTVWTFLRRTYLDGIWLVYPLRYGRRTFSLRHLAPLAFVAGMIGGAALSWPFHPVRYLTAAAGTLYVLVSAVSSVSLARREKEPELAALLPPTFAALHVAYGLGSLDGALRVTVAKARGLGRRIFPTDA